MQISIFTFKGGVPLHRYGVSPFDDDGRSWKRLKVSL